MNKRNKIILISLCLILAICAVSTAGVLIWKNTAEKAPVSEEILIDGGEASVSDEAALRELLLKEEELVITLTEDITVDESLVVKGKKTLSGTGSIKMALYVMPYESLITVAENATLILDGVTVNGNGIANGVKVEKTANLTLVSGEVAWGNPYGIEVQGNAEIKGGTITDAIHTGILIGTSGNVQMSAGNVKSAGYASTRISKGGYFGFGGDAILQNCGVYHIHNAGTCDVTGGVVRDSEYTLATTEGDLNIHYQGTDGGMIEWYNATGSGIFVGEGGNLNASGFYIHDVGYAGVNSGQGTGAIKMTNCKFENTGNNGLHIKMATAELKDIEIIKPGKHGVFVNSPTTVATIENLTVTEPAERGLHNAGAKTTAKNVTVTSPGTYGVSTGSSGDTVGSLIVENLTVTEAGSNPENSQPAVNCYKSSLTVIGATLTDSNNAGARVTDGGQLTLKNVKIKNTESYGVYVVHNKSKATLENVSVSNTGKHGVYVNNGGAKANISKLTVTNAGERGIHNAGGIITAKNVTINGSGLYGVSTGNHTDSKTGKSTAGSVTIDNLTVTGAKGDAAVNSYKSVLTITNGKIKDSAKVGVRVTDGGTLKLTDVEITKTGYEGVLISSEGKATLKNIVVTNAGKHGVYVYKANSKADIDTLTVVEPVERGLHNAGGTITAKNVTITNSGLYGVSTGNYTDAEGKVTAGSVTVDNLTVTGAKGDAAVNSYKSVLTVTNAKIKDSAKIGARVTDGGTLKLTDVEIDKTGTGCEGVLVNSKGQATLKNVTVTNAGKHGVYVNGADSKADIDTLTVTEPAERGLHNAGGTIIAKNVTITSPGTYGVSTGNSGESKGSVKVTNLTVTNAGAIPTVNEDGSKTIQPAVNSYNSVLTVVDAKLIDSNGVGARATDGGELNLTNVEIENAGQHGVYVNHEGSVINIEKLTITKTGQNYNGIYAIGKSQVNLSGINTITDAGKDGICANGAGTVVNINTQEGATAKKDALTIVTPAQRGIRNEGATVVAANVTVTDPGTYGVSTAKSGDSAGSVVVSNLTVTGAGQTEKQPAVNAHNGSVMTVNGAKISDCKNAGARATQGATITLNDVEITDVSSHGVYVEGVDSKAFIDTLTILKTEDAAYSAVRGIYNIGGTVEAKHVSVDTPKEYGVSTLAHTDKESGVVTNGSMLVEDLTVTNSQGNASVYANNSVLTVNEGTLRDSKKDGALVNNGGTLNLTDVVIDEAVRHGVYVDGASAASTANLTRVSITNAGFHGVFVNGSHAEAYATDLTVTTTNEYTLNEKAEYGDVRVSAGAYAEMEKVSITGSKEHGIYVDSNSELNLTGINSVSSTGKHGVFANGVNAKININTQEGAAVETDNLTITTSGERGIHNVGGTIVAKNVKVDRPGTYGVSTGNSGNTAGSVTIYNLTVTGAGRTTVQPAVNSFKSVLNVIGATITDSKGVGARVTDGGTLNLTDVEIKNSASYGIYINHAKSVANVSGVKIDGGKNSEYGSIYVTGSGKLNLSGESSITNAKKAGIYVAVNSTANINANQNESTKEFTGLDKVTNNLTITGGERGIYNVGGTVTAYHVSVSNTSSYGVQSEYSGTTKGSVIVNDLSVSGAKGNASIYSKGSELTVIGGTLLGSKKDGTLVNNGGTLNLTDVDITNAVRHGVLVDTNSYAYITDLTVTTTDDFEYTLDGTIDYGDIRVNSNGYAKVVDATIQGAKEYGVYSTGAGAVIDISGLNVEKTSATSNRPSALMDGVRALSKGTVNMSGINSISDTGRHGINVYQTDAKVNINTQEGATPETDYLTITGVTERGICNEGGTIVAKNVKVDSSGNYGVSTAKNQSVGSVTIDNLTVVNASASTSYTNPALNVYNGSVMTINGGTISQSNGAGARSDTNATLNLSNVTIDTTGSYGIHVKDSATLNLSGESSITNAKTHGIYVAGTSTANINTTSGTLTITDCENGIYNNGGTVNAQNVVINTPNVYGVLAESGSRTTITGLTVNGAKIQVSEEDATDADAAVFVNNSELTIIGTETATATITNSAKNGVGVIGGGVLNLTNVAINSSGAYGVYVTGSGSKATISGLNIDTTATKKDAVYAVNNGEINLSGISNITNAGKHGVYADGAGTKININKQEGATAEKDVLTITSPVERGVHNNGGTINAYNVIVNTPGEYGVSTGNDEEVKGSVTVEALTVTGAGTIKAQPAVNSYNSVLTINGALIENSKNAGARVTDGGTLNLNDVEIKNSGSYGNYGVYVSDSGSTANVSGLTINKVSANNGIHVAGGAILNLTGVSSITDTAGHGIYVAVNSTANINVKWDENTSQYAGLNSETDKLTILRTKQGIKTDGGIIRAYNLTINTPSEYGIAIYSGNNKTVRGYADIHNLTTNGVKGNAAVYANGSDVYVTGGNLIDSTKTGVWAYNNDSGSGNIWLTDVTINGKGTDYYAIWSRGKDSIITVKNPTFLNVSENERYQTTENGRIVEE